LLLLIVAATPALAQNPTAQTSSTVLQRPIADDISVDQDLVSHITPQTVAHAQPVATTNIAASTDEPEYHMASVGPALPLLPRFNPLWPTRGLITT